MGLALTELDTIGDNSEAAPEWRARNPVLTKPRLRAENFLFEKRATGNFRALGRCPGAQPAFTRTGLKIFFRFAARQFVHASFDPQLALELGPVEHNCGARIRGEVGGLAAGVIGVEHEAAPAHAAIEHHTHGWMSGASRRRERHGLGQRLACAHRIAKPLVEQHEWVWSVFDAVTPGRRRSLLFPFRSRRLGAWRRSRVVTRIGLQFCHMRELSPYMSSPSAERRPEAP